MSHPTDRTGALHTRGPGRHGDRAAGYRHRVDPVAAQPTDRAVVDGYRTPGGLVVAVADPTNVMALDDIKLHTGASELLVLVSTPSQIRDHIARAWSLGSDTSGVDAMVDSMDDDDDAYLPAAGRHAEHWRWRPDWKHDRACLWWYLTFEDAPAVRGLAQRVQHLLGRAPQLDLIPFPWLHLTLLEVGFADEVPAATVARQASSV